MTILQENLTQKFVTFVGIFGDFAGRNSAILCLGSGKFGVLTWAVLRVIICRDGAKNQLEI